MIIGIDASRYGHPESTGVENYSYHIINEIVGLEKGVKLYSREYIVPAFKGAKNVVLRAKRLWTLSALSKEMRVNKPDVLFVPSHVLPLSLAKRNVITIHDVAFKHLRGAYSFFQYHYLNWSTKRAVKKADKIIVPSKATREDLVKFYRCPSKKIVVIPHGFEKPKKSPGNLDSFEIFKYFGINGKFPYILFVGRLESKKNLARLIKAFEKFSKKHPKYRLILAGKRGVGFEKLLKLKNVKNVIMPGYVTENEKATLMMNAKIFAFPSLYEGFGLPILEAFYFGKPVLCSRTSSLPEVGGNAVHYVNPMSVESVFKGLEKLADDKKYAESLVRKGKKRLRLFSWKKAGEKTLEVLYG